MAFCTVKRHSIRIFCIIHMQTYQISILYCQPEQGKKQKSRQTFFFLVYTFSPSPCCLHRTLVSFYALDLYLTIEGCFMFVISWFIQIDFCLQAIFTIKCFCMQQILLKIYLIQILQWIRAGLNTPVNLNTKIGFSYISHDWKLSFHFKCFEIHSKCMQFMFVRKRTSTKSIDIQCIIHPVRRRKTPSMRDAVSDSEVRSTFVWLKFAFDFGGC